MENVMTPFGLSTAVLNFTNDLSLLLVGLICLLGLSGGMIVWSAVRHYWSEKIRLAPRSALTATDLRDVA